jgi:hypothetical protein
MIDSFGFLQSGGVLHILQPSNQESLTTGKINDYRQGVGSLSSTTFSVLLFEPPSTFHLLRNISTYQEPYMFGAGLNNNGNVVGYFRDNLGLYHGFLGVR